MGHTLCGDGAVREWIEKGEEQLFVNILECPFARVWNEEDAALGHAFCEEFYPAYVKAASNEKAQINLGKTLTNEGDEFCRISCYLPQNKYEPGRQRRLFSRLRPCVHRKGVE